jgi:uncharacterized alkaline shock family protein YloU
LKTFGLVGTSGTGKSYKSVWVANERGIPCIIDDGLLIMGTRILAGTSAKRERTKLSAIRRALFMDPDHGEQVREAIQTISPSAVLVIGTSVPMIERIVQQLNLPPVEEIIRIEDVASDREIRIAQKQRREEGKHIIPVPTFEVKKDFSGFFIDPLRIFRVKGRGRQIETLEKTVVRPTYSYFGRFTIADSAVKSIAVHCTMNIPGVHRVQRCDILSQLQGISIELDITVVYGWKIHEIMQKIQERVGEEVGFITGLNILAVNVTARKVIVLKDDSASE